MAEKNNVFEQVLKQKGFFNYTELYNFCYNWFKGKGYRLSENQYTEKLQSNGKELVIEWKAEKKVSDYFKEEINIKWHILGLNDAEVMIDDKKEKTNKGEVKLKISADLVKDYEENWEKSVVYKFFRGVYDKYIIRNTTSLYEDRLRDNALEFFEDTKAFLNIEGKS